MAQGPLRHAELEARGIVEQRKKVVTVTVDGEYAIHYAKDKRGQLWRWDPTKGFWRAARKWPEKNEG